MHSEFVMISTFFPRNSDEFQTASSERSFTIFFLEDGKFRDIELTEGEIESFLFSRFQLHCKTRFFLSPFTAENGAAQID